MNKVATFVLLLLTSLPLAQNAQAQAQSDDQMLEKVQVTQKLGEQIPLELEMINETGENITLGSLLQGKPTFLTPIYFECPMLCSLVLNGFLKTIQRFSLILGQDFDVITYSFDPTESYDLARKKKKTYVNKYGKDSAAESWHFITGSQESIEALNQAIGFDTTYDPETKRYAHAATVLLLTPEGKITNYFSGIEFNPRDFRLAIVEASKGKIGNAIDFILLTCFHYDPATGKYGFVITKLIRIAGIATVLIIAGFIATNLKQKKTAV